MSESKHSPERLSADPKRSLDIWPEPRDQHGPVAMVSPVRDDTKENLRRIVALWNACAGIPTEALESGALGKALEAMRRVYDLTSEDAARAEMEIALRALRVLK